MTEDLNAICAACGMPRGDHSREAFDYRKLAVNDNNVTWIWPLEACPFGSQPFNEKQSFVPVIPASLSAPSAPHKSNCNSGLAKYPNGVPQGINADRNCDCGVESRESQMRRGVPASSLVVSEPVRELVEALRNLAAEVSGLIGMAEFEIRAIAGNTNVNCIQRRLAEAERGLARYQKV